MAPAFEILTEGKCTFQHAKTITATLQCIVQCKIEKYIFKTFVNTKRRSLVHIEYFYIAFNMVHLAAIIITFYSWNAHYMDKT